MGIFAECPLNLVLFFFYSFLLIKWKSNSKAAHFILMQNATQEQRKCPCLLPNSIAKKPLFSLRISASVFDPIKSGRWQVCVRAIRMMRSIWIRQQMSFFSWALLLLLLLFLYFLGKETTSAIFCDEWSEWTWELLVREKEPESSLDTFLVSYIPGAIRPPTKVLRYKRHIQNSN